MQNSREPIGNRETGICQPSHCIYSSRHSRRDKQVK